MSTTLAAVPATLASDLDSTQSPGGSAGSDPPSQPPADEDPPQPFSRKSSRLGSLLTSRPASVFRLSRANPAVPDAISTAPLSKGPLGLTTLHQPIDVAPAVDIVFIHGLGGDSFKTWADSSQPGSFWPRDWLPQDADFKYARVHTFGYDADWRPRTASILSVHDFAQSLVGELKNNPLLRKSESRIILVGHSMGGCVAKKAYTLARQDPANRNLASRFHSLFFLATPHRGSNLAKILRAVLQVAGVAKPFINDLVASSPSVFEANEAFQKYSSDLRLWSFFESLPLSDYSGTLVVDSFSATLGYSNEQTSYMDADHRGVCKFNKQSDHNYQKLRNALSSAVEMIVFGDNSLALKAHLEAYLKVNDSFEDDLAMLLEMKTPGTCEWVTKSEDFLHWKDAASDVAPFYMIQGVLGSGKSVISSHIVAHLRDQSIPCSHFFFKQGQEEAECLTPLLMSLAYQMALKDPSILRKVIQLQANGITWDNQGDRFIWRKLFMETIFRERSCVNHYWVIDGVDECPQVSDLFTLLDQVPTGLRVFLASRNNPTIENCIQTFGRVIKSRQLRTKDTVSDLLSVIKTKLGTLPTMSSEYASDLASKILQRSAGSFLWTRLVLQELETVCTDEDIEEVLEEIPNDLNDMYARILTLMGKSRRQARLAKSILTWVVLAIRPMTIDELREATQLDLGQTLLNIDYAITICSQLILLDNRHRVHIIHSTARAYLLRQGLESPLAVNAIEMHGKLAAICIRSLTNNLVEVGAFGFAGNRAVMANLPPLHQYCSDCFSQHILQSASENPQLFEALHIFITRGILSWIEYLSQRQDLSVVASTSNHLRQYLARSLIPSSESKENLKNLQTWAVDIGRIALNFRDQLLQLPSSIHYIIPSFCPSTSAIGQTTTKHKSPLRVLGLPDGGWRGSLTSFQYDTQITIIICGATHFAVCHNPNIVYIYSMDVFQNVAKIRHGREVAHHMVFGNQDKYLAVTGPSCSTIWDVASEVKIHHFECRDIIATKFLSSEIFAELSSQGTLMLRYLQTGTSQKVSFEETMRHVDAFALSKWSPDLAVLDPSVAARAAIAMPGSDGVLVLDIFEASCVKILREPDLLIGEIVSVRSLAFNPNIDMDTMMVSYSNGSLSCFKISTTERTSTLPKLFAESASWFVGGEYFAASVGERWSLVNIYHYAAGRLPAISLLQQCEHPGHQFFTPILSCHETKYITASYDKCRVWELDRPSVAETSNDATDGIESHDFPISEYSSISPAILESGIVTAIAVTMDGQTILCGYDSGQILAYNSRDASLQGSLCEHPSTVTLISLVHDSQLQAIISADESGGVIVAVPQEIDQSWVSASVLFERSSVFAEGLLVNSSNTGLLLLTNSDTQLWSFPSGEVLMKQPHRLHNPYGQRSLAQHPLDDDKYIVFANSSVEVFSWDDYEMTPTPLALSRLAKDGFVKRREIHSSHIFNCQIWVEKVCCDSDKTWAHCWDVEQFKAASNTGPISPRKGLSDLNSLLQDTISLKGSVLIFVDKQRWICSLNLDLFPMNCLYKRHFFIFPEWVGRKGEMQCYLAQDGDLVFGTRHGPVIVRGWEREFHTMLVEHWGDKS